MSNINLKKFFNTNDDELITEQSHTKNMTTDTYDMNSLKKDLCRIRDERTRFKHNLIECNRKINDKDDMIDKFIKEIQILKNKINEKDSMITNLKVDLEKSKKDLNTPKQPKLIGGEPKMENNDKFKNISVLLNFKIFMEYKNQSNHQMFLLVG